MPLAPGHVLVVSRSHHEKLKDLSGVEGAALGFWLPVVSRCVMRALGHGDMDYNVVQNNGITAAMVVPHVHYHIIPRVAGAVSEIRAKSWTMFGRGQRTDLDDDEGAELASSIREELMKDLRSMSASDREVHRLLGKL